MWPLDRLRLWAKGYFRVKFHEQNFFRLCWWKDNFDLIETLKSSHTSPSAWKTNKQTCGIVVKKFFTVLSKEHHCLSTSMKQNSNNTVHRQPAFHNHSLYNCASLFFIWHHDMWYYPRSFAFLSLSCINSCWSKLQDILIRGTLSLSTPCRSCFSPTQALFNSTTLPSKKVPWHRHTATVTLLL